MAKKNTTTGGPKRLIMSATNKGGVGKSFFMVQLAQYLKEHEAKPRFLAFDPDYANETLSQFHGDCTERIDVERPEAIDRIVHVLLQDLVDISIVDGLGSQQKKTFQSWVDGSNLFELISDRNIRVTYVLVIEEDRDTILQAREILTQVGDAVDWLIVLNHRQSPRNELWEGSQARKLAMELSAVEIVLAGIPKYMMDFSGMKGLPIALAASDPDIEADILTQGRFRVAWAKQIRPALAQAEDVIFPHQF